MVWKFFQKDSGGGVLMSTLKTAYPWQQAAHRTMVMDTIGCLLSETAQRLGEQV